MKSHQSDQSGQSGHSGQSGQMWSIWSNLVKSGQVWSNLVVLVVWSPGTHIFRGPKKQPFLIVYSTHGVYLYHTPGLVVAPTGGGYARG